MVSRHSCVWLSFRQTVEDVIDGFEARWGFYGGVFKVVIPDNLKAIVDQADPASPRINPAFLEYAQARGFVVDPARVRRPQDKLRVERTVAYARDSMWAGEDFAGLADAQRRAEIWCRVKAGMPVHGTTRARPAEMGTRAVPDAARAHRRSAPLVPHPTTTTYGWGAPARLDERAEGHGSEALGRMSDPADTRISGRARREALSHSANVSGTVTPDQ